MPLINVIPKTLFSFDGRLGSTQEITIRNVVSMVDFVSGVLLVRLHAKVGWTGTASAAVVLQPIQIVPEEPQTFFIPTSPDYATATLVNGDVAPVLYTTTFSNPPSHVKVLLRWLQGGTAASGGQNFAIGVDIDGRVA
jgi:hypothetical protein